MRIQRAVWQSTELDGSFSDTGRSLAVAWRPLRWREFRRFSEVSPVPHADVYETCLVEGPTLDKAPAGIVRWIAEREIGLSPFSGKYEQLSRAIEQKRTQVQSDWMTAARALVAGTFRYTFEEMDDWTPDTFFERVAQAELLIGKPLLASDPSKPDAAQKKQQRSNKPRPSATNETEYVTANR